MKKQIFAFVVPLIVCLIADVFALEQLHITFDPPLVPGGVKPLDNWVEQGILFTGPYGFSQNDSGLTKCPDDGTAYLTFTLGPAQTSIFQCETPTPFRLISIDLAEYSTLFQKSKKITFIGHKTNRATVTTAFTLDGIIDGTGPLSDFEIFTFGVEFSNLSYVEIPTTGYCMDNLVIDTTPGFTAVQSLNIVGPAEVVEGDIVQYNAAASYTNGVSVNVTSASTLTVEPESYAHVDITGLLTTKNIEIPLAVTIHATYTEGETTLKTSAIVQVLPSLTLHVPSQFTTIQAAIDAARNGDVVVIAPGIYTDMGNRDIDFKGKKITVRSTDPNDPNIVATTIIDCNGSVSNPHRGFFFHSGENSRSVLSGLTIINGHAPLFRYQPDYQTYNYWAGGAVFCYESSPAISLCRFAANCADWFGGAIACWESRSTITECTIINNIANSGGGVYVIGSEDPTLNRCIISNNTACGGNIGLGGNCGGGVFSHGGTTMKNCLLFGNRAQVGGAVFTGGDAQILNCTISANIADRAGAVCCGEHSSPAIINSILWGNTASNGDEIAMTRIDWGSHLFVSYSNIRGGKNGIFNTDDLHWGYGNTDTDPFFIDPNNGDYHLSDISPCINAGDPNYVPEPNETDLDGLPRTIGGRIDMGAYEFNHIPVADAGPDQTVYADPNNNATVTLDGSASFDDDNDPLTYLWKWSIDGNDFTCTEPNFIVELPAGQYSFELTVNDGIENSEPNDVNIMVVPPLKAGLEIMPNVINRAGNQPRIMGMLSLAGIAKNQIDMTKPLLLYPGGIKSVRTELMQYNVRGVPHTMIFARFDKDELMSAVGNGGVKLRVVGKLKTGQYFYGDDSVTVKGHRWPFWR